MALPKAVKKDEFEKTVPELAREHYSLDEGTGEFHLGLVPKGELSQFRDNNITLQKEITAIKDKFKDLDPEQARKALARIKELEAGGGNGNFTKEQLEKEIENRTSNMKKSHGDELGKLQEANKGLNARLTNVLINQKINEIALSKEVGVKPEALSVLSMMAERIWTLDDKGSPVAKDSNGVMYGNDGKPLDMKSWIMAQKKDHGYLFNEPTGGGANGDKGRGNSSGLKRSKMSTKEKSDFISANGREAYEALPLE